MPDVAVHLSFGEDVRRSLPPDIQRVLQPDPYAFALLGPDIWFMHKPWIRRNGRGRRMHTTKTGAFLTALAHEAISSSAPEGVFSYLAGFLCHYCLDSAAHPYIIRMTTTEYPIPGAHRAFEHTMDVLELSRQGTWGKRHPMTGHNFRSIRLPREIYPALDAAYRQTYGWTGCCRRLNQAYRLFRFVYRLMENPKGIGVLLTRVTGSDTLKSLMYSESPFAGMDVENLGHRPWAHGFDDTLWSEEGIPELREKARLRAVALIRAAYDCIFLKAVSLPDLSAQIGCDSYLSGLPMGDSRSLTVPSMMPSEDISGAN